MTTTTTATISFDRAAEIMGLSETRLPAGKRAMARIVALFGTKCERCGGDGSYGATNYYGDHRCYGCDGLGAKVSNLTEEMARNAKTLTDEGALAGYFEQAKLYTARKTFVNATGMGRNVVAIFTELSAFVASRSV